MITKEQVQHAAKLARIRITKEETEQFQREFTDILEYFEKLAAADTEDVEPMTHSAQVENVTRQDLAGEPSSALTGKLCRLAGAAQEGFVKVVAILRP